MVNLQIKPNTYYDSITLMIISKELKKVPGVKEALVGMGTDLNLDIAKVTGLSSPELEAITPNDFFVALDCENEQVVEAALKALEEQLNKKEESRNAAYYPPTLTSALKADPAINLALISVPGRHAYDVAKDALDKNELYEQWSFHRDGASRIAQLLFEEATDINFFVGRAVNPAHQNPELPITFNIKMNLVEELSTCLKQMGKRIKVSYF